MPKNTADLKQSARRRSEQAMDRALAALQRMDAFNLDINFRSVAAEARVSRAWLYRQGELRSRIMRILSPSVACVRVLPYLSNGTFGPKNSILKFGLIRHAKSLKRLLATRT